LTAEVRREMLASEQTVTGRMEKLEVRLHDYGREVEGRIETRIAVLNQLLIEADREIKRLRLLLSESDGAATANPEDPRSEDAPSTGNDL